MYSPIVHTHPIALASGIDPLDGEFWMNVDDAMIKSCDALLICKMRGWEESSGVTEEIKRFQKADKPIYSFIPIDARLNLRKDALRLGLKTYHGRPCRRCGTTEKYTSAFSCVHCNCDRRHMSLGLTASDYEQMVEEQNGCCKICGVAGVTTKQGKLFVDHDHDTGQVRGLLCSNCNLALGLMKDNVKAINGMIEYLLNAGRTGE